MPGPQAGPERGGDGAPVAVAVPVADGAVSASAGESRARAQEPAREAGAAPARRALTARERAVHLLSRLSYAPTPADLAEVERLGLRGWVDQYLTPGQPADARFARRMTELKGVSATPGEAWEWVLEPRLEAGFRRDGEYAGEVVDDPPATEAAPSDVVDAAVDAAGAAMDAPGAAMDAPAAGMEGPDAAMDAPGPATDAASASDRAPVSSDRASERASSDRGEASAPLTEAELQTLRERVRDEERRRLYQLQFEFLGATLARAVESDRQPEEVLADFWRNHFNVDVRKNRQIAALWMPEWENQVLRGHLWGSFDALLEATAKHPAMLEYLDQAQSRRAFTEQEIDRFRARALRAGREPERVDEIIARRARGGPNENYARELMELHTLGVDTVYGQADVIAVAEALTGWTIRRRANTAERSFTFVFDPNRHAAGPKQLFGEPLPDPRPRTPAQGEEILRRLAARPETAEYVCGKLVARLVADDPPPALVDAAVAAWHEHDRDLTAVVRAVVLHPDFYAPEHYRAKVKTPWEYVVSALRAVGAEVHDPRQALRALEAMGQPLYQCEVPTGWSDAAEAWLDPGAMAFRWDFAERLAAGRLRGVHLPRGMYADWFLGHAPTEWPRALLARIVPAGVSAQTEAALEQVTAEYLERPVVRRRGARPAELGPQLLALTLGSPEFQRQ